MNTLFQSRISFWAFLCTGNKNKQTKYLVILFVLIDNIFNVVAFAFTELFGKQGRRKHLKLFRVLRKTSDLRERKQMSTGYKHHASCGNLSCTGDIGLWSRNGKAGRDHVHHVGCIFWHRISYEAAYDRKLPQVSAIYGQCV